ncbi:hypothetical protein TELCIR_10039 [Teladorsagia circumcincta]|uniref:Arylesterase n=1 Tax=Teladorsagia circumcincta TaxID=45464 RepID=A0A2G9UD66_TELCI|nr:hypothetical protein TELCIR_10039 [Teladorsagia circumcincta]
MAHFLARDLTYFIITQDCTLSLFVDSAFKSASSYLISRSVSPNGIILNKERTHVIISHVNLETISVYKLNKNNNTLSHVVDVPTLTSADNFCIDKSGAVWTVGPEENTRLLFNL